MEVTRDVEGELCEMKRRNEELAEWVRELETEVGVLYARLEAQVRRAQDAWRQIRAILGHVLRG
jgi:hypothetical protein